MLSGGNKKKTLMNQSVEQISRFLVKSRPAKNFMIQGIQYTDPYHQVTDKVQE
jgi:hypothetical protein